MKEVVSPELGIKMALIREEIFSLFHKHLEKEKGRYDIAITILVRCIALIVGKLADDEEELMDMLMTVNATIRHESIEMMEINNKRSSTVAKEKD